MIRYFYNFDKKEEIKLFWIGKRKKTKRAIEMYMNGTLNYWEILKHISHSTLYRILSEMKWRKLIYAI